MPKKTLFLRESFSLTEHRAHSRTCTDEGSNAHKNAKRFLLSIPYLKSALQHLRLALQYLQVRLQDYSRCARLSCARFAAAMPAELRYCSDFGHRSLSQQGVGAQARTHFALLTTSNKCECKIAVAARVRAAPTCLIAASATAALGDRCSHKNELAGAADGPKWLPFTHHVLHDEPAHILQFDVDFRVLELLPPRFFVLEPECHQRHHCREGREATARVLRGCTRLDR